MVRRKMIVLLLFIIVIIVSFSLKVHMLFDFFQILLLILGTALFYIAGNGLKVKQIQVDEIGKYALMVGFWEALVLVITGLQALIFGEDNVWRIIGSNMRPLLYGFSIWMVTCQSSNESKQDDKKESSITLEDYYELFYQKGLTRRETEIAVLSVKGLTNSEIGYELSIAETTVKKHMANIFEKTGVKKRDELRFIP